MKKILFFLLAVLTTLFLQGCGYVEVIDTPAYYTPYGTIYYYNSPVYYSNPYCVGSYRTIPVPPPLYGY